MIQQSVNQLLSQAGAAAAFYAHLPEVSQARAEKAEVSQLEKDIPEYAERARKVYEGAQQKGFSNAKAGSMSVGAEQELLEKASRYADLTKASPEVYGELAYQKEMLAGRAQRNASMKTVAGQAHSVQVGMEKVARDSKTDNFILSILRGKDNE